jgi:hypothetical protein
MLYGPTTSYPDYQLHVTRLGVGSTDTLGPRTVIAIARNAKQVRSWPIEWLRAMGLSPCRHT